MSALRSRALAAFKDLHKARQQTFRGDDKLLALGREKINTEFRKNKNESNPKAIEKHISDAEDASRILRQHILQLEEIGDNSFRANITKDTYKIDNIDYRDISEEELYLSSRTAKRRNKNKTCEEIAKENINK